ncbi:helix-turn-helix domain-containing protein [Paenibacillus solisilvae]|uniref:Helix-turn-helix domain-containing protein n=1 Tax=Paenibacillus solisilvae TaxID=2486751 RepID=A0ABW0VW99_9BACL
MERIAEHLSFSVSYLRQAFREVTDMTVFRLEEKVVLVKKLLTSIDLTMAGIMDRSGFITKSYFFASFKKIMRLTPKQFRDSKMA